MQWLAPAKPLSVAMPLGVAIADNGVDGWLKKRLSLLDRRLPLDGNGLTG